MSAKTSAKIVPIQKTGNCSQAVLIDKTLRHLIALAGAANEGIAILDNNAAIKFANPAFIAMHGYEAQQQVIGRTIHGFQNTDKTNDDIAAFIAAAENSKQLTGSFEHIRLDGSVFQARTRLILLTDKQNNTDGFLVFVNDLTERMQTEKSFAEKNNKLAQDNEQMLGKIAEFTKIIEDLRRQNNENLENLSCADEHLKKQIAENDVLTARLTEMNHQLETLTNDYQTRLKNENADADRRIAEKISEINDVSKRLESQISEHSELKKKFTEQSGHLEQNAIELEKLQAKLDEKTARLNEANQQIDRESAERSELQKYLAERSDELADINEKFNEQVSVNQNLEQIIEQNRQQLDKKTDEYQQLEKLLAEKTAELNDVRQALDEQISKNQNLEQTVEQTQNLLEQSSVELKQLQVNLDDKSARLNEANQQLEKESSERAAAQMHLSEKSDELADINEKLSEQISVNQHCEQVIEQARQQLDKKVQEYQQLEEHFTEKSSRLASAENELKQQIDLCSVLQDKLAIHKQSEESLTWQISELDTANQRLSTENQEQNLLIEQMKVLFQQQQNDLAQAQSSLQQTQQQYEQANQQITQYEEQLQKMTSEFLVLHKQISQQGSKHHLTEKQLNYKITELTDVNNRLKEQIAIFDTAKENLQQQLQEKHALLDVAHKQIEEQSSEKIRLKQQIQEYLNKPDLVDKQTKIEQEKMRQQMDEKMTELAAVKEQLKQQTTQRIRAEKIIYEYKQAQEKYSQKISELDITNKLLQGEVDQRKRMMEQLTAQMEEQKDLLVKTGLHLDENLPLQQFDNQPENQSGHLDAQPLDAQAEPQNENTSMEKVFNASKLADLAALAKKLARKR